MIHIPNLPHEKLENVSWPTLRSVERPSVSSGDVLLLCAGFESRAAEVLKRLCSESTSAFSVILVEYQPAYEENRSDEIRALAKDANVPLTAVSYDRKNPAGICDSIRNLINRSTRLWIDISGMSRLLIVQVLVGLLSDGFRALSIIYTEAEEYPPSQDEFKSNFQDGKIATQISYLSSGVFEIAVAPELSSVSMLGEATRLIAFPSFDPSQLSNVLDELQPTYTELIHGVPPRPENQWRRDGVEALHGKILNDLRGRTDHQVSTLNYEETLQVLVSIYCEHNSFDRLAICPTGSKMQTVAVGLFRAVAVDVQIVYPTPQSFVAPNKYTFGVRSLYQVDVPELPIPSSED